MVERLVPLRNLKYAVLRRRLFPSVGALCELIAGRPTDGVDVSAPVALIGLYNEFDPIWGKNCVFFSLDGRDYLARQAVAHGALAVVCTQQIGSLPCILVQDVQEAFLAVCRALRAEHPVPATVITGSIGKTTTKEMTACVLQGHFRTFCAPINGNVLQYLGFELQHIPRRAQQFVQEVDESYPRNASRCSEVLQPGIAIITNIDRSHIGELGSEENLIRAITSITDGMSPDGHLILNADDPRSIGRHYLQKVHTVGIAAAGADCTASNIRLESTRTVFDLHYAGETATVTINLPGNYNIYNAMMAFVAGKLAGVPTAQILRSLKRYRPMTVRQKLYRAGGVRYYVDCFNASARSVKGALDVTDRMPLKNGGRRIAVLGDIAGIDGFEEQTYREVCTAVRDASVDLLLTYGTGSASIRDLLGAQCPAGQHFSSEQALVSYLKQNRRRGDILLFKASGIMHLDSVVKSLIPISYYVRNLGYYCKHLHWILQTL